MRQAVLTQGRIVPGEIQHQRGDDGGLKQCFEQRDRKKRGEVVKAVSDQQDTNAFALSSSPFVA